MSTVYRLSNDVGKEELIDQLGVREVLRLAHHVSGQAVIDGRQTAEEHQEASDKILELADRICE